MDNIKRFYSNISIRKKFSIFTASMIILIILAMGISTNNIMSIANKQTHEQFSVGIKELCINIDNYFVLVERSFDYIANNVTVQEELNSNTPYTSDGSELYSYYSRAGEIRRLLLQGYTSIYMDDIQLYGNNGANHVLSVNGNKTVEKEADALELAKQNNGKCCYFNASDVNGFVYMVKQVKDSLTRVPLGFLRSSIKVSYLKKLAESTRNTFSSEVILLDSDQKEIFSSIEDYDDAITSDDLSNNKDTFSITINGIKYYATYVKSTTTGYTLIGLQSAAYVTGQIWKQERFLIILMLIMLSVGMLLVRFFANQISKPIMNTSTAMEKFAEGDFSVRLPEGRKDEIGVMNSSFNHTIQQIEGLLNRIVEMERVNKDVEFQALQAQINPHFLYNVLDTINWMARKKKEEDICHMISAISHLLRQTLSNRKMYITVGEEINYIRDYLYIQETRYQHRFSVNIDIDESVNSLMIPKMTIQTLVENAVVHGVENAVWDCYLDLEAYIENGNAVFVIRDNGIGISPEKVTQLMSDEYEREPAEETTHSKLGIYAVKTRLNYAFGSAAKLEIESAEGQGTTATVIIPMDGGVMIDENQSHDIR